MGYPAQVKGVHPNSRDAASFSYKSAFADTVAREDGGMTVWQTCLNDEPLLLETGASTIGPFIASRGLCQLTT
jgi:hypothetical protein